MLDVLVSCAKFAGTDAVPVARSELETLFPIEICQFVRLYQYPHDQATIVTVDTAKVQANEQWEVADALVSAFSRANVETLTVVAAAHLPYAKDGGLNVFYRNVNVDAAGEDVAAMLPAADPVWEIKDPWLAALLHWIRVEQWPRTHVLLAKGHKPGRDLAGTYEAVEALSRALPLFASDMTVDDTLLVQQRLARVLTTENSTTTTTTTALTARDEHIALLYR